jgi:hypothetical protein
MATRKQTAVLQGAADGAESEIQGAAAGGQRCG